MPLIVTTSHSLLTLDLDSGRLQTRHRGRGLYYGLAAHSTTDTHWVAARGRLVSDTSPMAEESGAILVLDAAWNERDCRHAPFPLRDLHEIAWHRDTLWATCSHDDLVALCRSDGVWRRWWPLGEPPPGAEPDRFHFNSLFFESELVWVLAHRRGPSRLLAFPLDAALAGRTVEPVRVLDLGVQAHNIWRMDGALCTCSSAEGCLVSTSGWRLEVGGFTRGIARLPHGWAVGVSELAERRERDWTTGSVVVFDEQWREIGRLELPGEGLVLDLLWSDLNAPYS